MYSTAIRSNCHMRAEMALLMGILERSIAVLGRQCARAFCIFEALQGEVASIHFFFTQSLLSVD